mmetsp:Transcript_118189/g.166133  ORF Transcript_118189/g.166133 Transcript_118189/m.166133 type:complete len:192 (+) Transcript_118189:35-610(+)
MDVVEQYLEQGNFPEAIQVIEQLELRGELDGAARALLFTLYLLEWRIDDAHFLFLRLNQQMLESNPEFKGLKSIQEAMASQPAPVNALAGLAFPKRLKPFMQVLQERLQFKSAELLRKSYSVVTLAHFAQALGKSPEEAIAAAPELGWEYSDTTSSLTRLDRIGGEGLIDRGISKLSLSQISSTIQKLERK